MECTKEQRSFIAFMLLAVCMALLMIMVDIAGMWGDVDHYWKNINDVFVDHRMPYSDAKFEYPPLALVVFLIPRLISWDLQSFRVAFGSFAILVFIAALLISYKIGEHLNIPRLHIYLMFFATGVSMFWFIIARYDIFPVALCLLAILLYVEGKHNAAFVVISLAAMVKLYPVLIALCFMIPYFSQRKWGRLAKGILICLLVAFLSELPFLLDNFSTAFNYLSYHSARGIQVESVMGTIIELWYLVDPSCCHVVFNYGSDNLAGPLPDMIAPFMNYLLLGAILGFIVLALYGGMRIKSSDEETMNRFVILSSTAIVLIFIVFNKVYSAQYWIWFSLMIPICLCALRDQKSQWVFTLVVIIGCLTSFLGAFFYNSNGMYNLDSGIQYIEAVKNAFTIGILCVLMKWLLNLTYAEN